MRKIFALLAINLFAFHLTLGQSDPISALRVNSQRFALPNGMRVVLMPDSSEAEISLEFWLHVGARDEVDGKHGFAHFFEHATPYGLRNDEPARTKFRSFLTNSNAQTRKDYLRYYLQLKPEGLELALRYVAERMSADPEVITTDIVENHRKNVLGEMARQQANPLYGPLASDARDAVTFGSNHPYGHSTYGTLAENQRFTVADVKLWYGKYFYPENIVLFVAGNFDPEKVKALLSSNFRNLKSRGTHLKFNPGIAASAGERIVKTSVPEHHLSLVWPIPAWGRTETDTAQLLAKVLDQRFNSRKPDFVTSAGSSDLFASFEHAGRFGVYASFKSLKQKDLVENFLREAIHSIANRGVTENELSQAKQSLIKETAEMRKALGFIGSRTELLGEGLLFRNDPDFFLKRIKTQQRLRNDDLKKSAGRLAKTEPGKALVLSSQNCDVPVLCNQ